jgi:DNA-binding transcriptional MerR regulator
MFTLINKEKSIAWSGESRNDLSNKSGISYNTLRTWERKIEKNNRYYEDSIFIYIESIHLKSKRGNIENLKKNNQ